ncbi:MAG: DUF4270 domain-containing protein [Bacteroidales bacterium]|nr:DUF4270 domain-containing protein [Bacteroidales bacterium]
MSIRNFMISCLRNKQTFSLILVFFLFSSALFIVSCDEDPTDLGIELLPPSDRMPAYYIDTVEVTMTPFTTPFYYASLNNPFLGVATDPVYGKLLAVFASDIYFPYAYDTATWGKRKIIDSVKLSLYFDSVVYHNPNPANPLDHSFKLAFYPLTKPIDKDSDYTSITKPAEFVSGASLLAVKQFDYPVKNQVSFYFPDNTLSYFQQYLNLDSTQVRSDTLRHEKGVYGLMFYPQYINNDIIYRLRTGDTLTYIEFTYHTEGDNTLYKIRGYFYNYYHDEHTSYGYNNGGISFISWDHSKAKVKTRLNGLAGDSLIYILAESPLRAKINFSGLNALIKPNFYNVIKADLYVAYDDYFFTASSNQTYTSKLKDIDLKILAGVDSFTSYTNVFGSPLYSATIDTSRKSYLLDVTDYINKRLNNATTVEELYFFPTYRYSVQSAFLKNRLKLKIKYIKR